MSEKPIIFNAVEVRAILEGCKKQTRRPVKPRPSSGLRKSVFCSSGLEDGHGREVKIPYQPGDILWVREAWANISDWTDIDPELGMLDGYVYKANWGDNEHPQWKPSIHMPREAARIFLKVTDVRVERVQDITENDVRIEGFRDSFDPSSDTFYPSGYHFVKAWNSIYAKRGLGWDINPWVWAISFERVNI